MSLKHLPLSFKMLGTLVVTQVLVWHLLDYAFHEGRDLVCHVLNSVPAGLGNAPNR